MKGSSVQPETPQTQYDELPARYEKLKTLWGEDALRAIVNAHVLVLGIGGVGSNCTEALARGGVGKLTILDRDVVEESNINRQSIAFYSTLGKRKVDVMEAMIKDINPEAQVKKVFGFLRQEEMESFLDEHARDVDYVVDAIDTISAKLKLAELAPNYSCEQPVDTNMGSDWERVERKDLGTASFVPPIFGQMIAGEVLRDLAGRLSPFLPSLP